MGVVHKPESCEQMCARASVRRAPSTLAMPLVKPAQVCAQWSCDILAEFLLAISLGFAYSQQVASTVDDARRVGNTRVRQSRMSLSGVWRRRATRG